ncbi:DUF2306 domain-containing protein [Cecembia rubra]|uniref:DUF2306 domain-containing protein n=1 Tax=Cecembia rubra TaxID=1485585 RepID=UPI002714F77E|nr:DUF2306 domain-containing protein [Cecembia rubra]
MSKMSIFWGVYFMLFIIFLLPTLSYLVIGLPDFLNRNSLTEKAWFIGHILSGIVVYTVAPFQLSTSVRLREPNKHRMLGKVYIFSSLVCILTLYANILPNSICESCQPSQYMATSLWLIFILLGLWSILNKKMELHRRFMMSGFICAAYFVTVRLVSYTLMGFFDLITPNEHASFLVSDIFVWLLPLLIFWSIWLRNK